MEKEKTRAVIKIILAVILALVSIFGVARYASSAEFHADTIQALDEKRATVMELTAASTAASAAITLIPGDTATPIAEKLADLSTYFLVVICAIYLEKYLVTITGYAAFYWLIPIACLLYILHILMKNDTLNYLSRKIFVFALAIVLVVPTSVKVSELIETTYQSSIQETLDAASETTKELEDAAEDENEKEEEGLLSGFLSKVKDGVSEVTTGVENTLNDFIEALAVLLVTSCVIPIVVILFFMWLVKIILGVEVPIPRNPMKP